MLPIGSGGDVYTAQVHQVAAKLEQQVSLTRSLTAVGPYINIVAAKCLVMNSCHWVTLLTLLFFSDLSFPPA